MIGVGKSPGGDAKHGHAAGRDGERAAEGAVLSRVVAPGYHRSLKDPDATAPVECLLPRTVLAGDAKEAAFLVTPVSSYGVKGKALETNVIKV